MDKEFLKTVTSKPGVYQMFDGAGKILYIGKAKNLKNRLSSYFRPKSQLTPKTAQLMSLVVNIEMIITETENEALLLECNLIKLHHPRYNVLLRDDKSYPYLYLSSHQEFPRLILYRGKKGKKGEYFGPFPSVSAVRYTLSLVQKIFKLRQCDDVFFKNRSRPCLQYQIKRCTAPCVKYIEKKEYSNDVEMARLFLQGKNEKVLQDLVFKMDQASKSLSFEEAANYRDQIASIRKVHAEQAIEKGSSDVDLIGVVQIGRTACVNVLVVRQGRVVGSKPFFVKSALDETPGEIIDAFIPQYYLGQPRGGMAKYVVINEKIGSKDLLAKALTGELGARVQLIDSPRGKRRQWLEMSVKNAFQALQGHVSSEQLTYQRFEKLQQVLKLDVLPERIECFDVSHTMGENTVSSMTVIGPDGLITKDYRRFNIKNVAPGDDYGALNQALTRHFKKLKEEDGIFPDILLIDGGKGQLNVAVKILYELQVVGVILLSIAKGPGRKPEFDRIFVAGRTDPLVLGGDSEALHVLQQVRDEAHRFAITAHRKQRGKQRLTSPLQEIEGVGPKRRADILKYFGGIQGVRQASLEDLMRVPGVSKEIATRILKVLSNN